MGIRTISPPVTDFCNAFKDTLEERSGTDVEAVQILNQYKSKIYSRYIGLLKDPSDPAHIDIECGPNSISSGQLVNPASERYFSEEIAFSRPFYITGIRLLLPKESAQRLSEAPPDELEDRLRELKIGVLEGTTTSKQFEDNDTLYQYTLIESIKEIESIKDEADPVQGKNSLERALQALDNNGLLDSDLRIDALASDAIILRALLETGVKGSGEKEDELVYIRDRPGYKQLNYAIFPSREFPSLKGNLYLPGLTQENYALAIRKGTESTARLSEMIDSSLSDLSTPESELSKAQDNLKSYELGLEQTSSLAPNLTVSPDPSLSPSDPSLPSTDSNPEPASDRWWVPVVVAAVAATASVLVALLNPQIVIAAVSWFKRKPMTPQAIERTITGRVLNARTGAWISGAKVSLEAAGTPPVEYTDSEGIFEFTFKSSSDKIRVRVEAENYEMFDRRIDLSNSAGIRDIRLSPVSNS